MIRVLFLAVMALTIPLAASADEKDLQVAIFAGGCFWCIESDFDKVPGVVETVSGYIGGTVENPTYRIVTAGDSGHKEAVRIKFDPELVNYEKLLFVFWRSVDPTDAGGQFCDRGDSYATQIYATNMEQLAQANASKEALVTSDVLKRPIVTPITAADTFYPAEDYHQDYYTRNPVRYKYYRFSCRRDARIEDLWGDQAHAGIPHS